MAELEVFDKTLQTTHKWLKEIGETIGPDKHRCYHALRAVLFALRDRLTLEEAFHLSAQLPILVRGIYWDGYRPSETPKLLRTEDEFLADVKSRFGEVAPLNARDSALAVFDVLARHLPAGEIEKIKDQLPREIRVIFDAAAPAVH